MKKNLLVIVLLFFAWAQSLAINTTTNLNPFAYNLSAVLSNDQTTLTVKYCLNANVESLEIVFLKAGEVVKRFPVTDAAKRTKTTADDPYLAAYSHSVDVQINDLGIGTFTWRIEVKGAGRSETQIYSQNGSTPLKYKFYRPSSVDIVMDPTSYNYGKVLVVEGNDAARSNTVTGTYHSSGMTKTKGVAVGSHDPQGAGIYVFNPDLTPRENTSGTYVFNGKDDNRFKGTTYGPHRVRISDDGRIFVASMHTDGNILWEIPATFGEWTIVMGKGVGGAKWVGNATSGEGVDTEYRLNTSGGTFFAAPVAGLDVRGSGENLQLLMLCCTEKAFGMGQTGYHTFEYNLGKATIWNAKPSKDFYTHSYIFVLPEYSQVQYDKDGAIWCSSYYESYIETSPALVHIPRTVSAIRTDDYRDYTSVPIRKAAFRFNNEYDKTIIAKWNAGASRVEGHIYRVGKDGSGKPTINGTGEPQIDMSAVGDYINDFVWDNADNIYAVGQNNRNVGEDGYMAVYCLPYKNTDIFTTSAPKPFTISNTVVWHPYHCGEVRNEDLWKLFMEDWNEWYMNSTTQPITVKKAEQPITGAFGFTLPADKDADGNMIYAGGLAMDFMTNEKSSWKWLGDYILPIANPHTIPADNEALWEEFKPYFKTYTGLNRSDMTIDNVATFLASSDNAKAVLTNSDSKYKWLGDYIIMIANEQEQTITQYWHYVLHGFFKTVKEGGVTNSQGTLIKYNIDFSAAGQPSAWQPYYQDAEGNVSLSTDLEWRKQIHAFFNHTNEVGYNKAGVWVTEKTGDFTEKGQPKPNGDPAAGWYNAWWNATFPADIQDGDPMPKVKRDGYVLAGWCYGTDEGYYMSQRVGTSGYDNNQPYKSHLWARWIELCLDENYKAADDCMLSWSLEEKGKSNINHNMELLSSVGGGTAKLDVKRSLLVGSYSTFVLPFAIPADKDAYLKKVTDDNGVLIFDPDENGGAKPSILVYDGTSAVTVNGEDILQFNFHELGDEEQLLANHPFLIQPGQSEKLTPRLHFWVAYVGGATPADVVNPGAATFVPVLAPQEISLPPHDAENPENDMVALILVDKNRLAKVTQGGDMLGLRGYFLVPKSLAQRPAQIAVRKDMPTGEESVEVYPVATAYKVVRDGRVYIVYDGRMYDMMGNLVK